MPYITEEDRVKFEKTLEDLTVPTVAGELNYLFTCIIKQYLTQKGVSYTNMNEVVGVLECAKLELYRRMTAPYEDKKIFENGDVYD